MKENKYLMCMCVKTIQNKERNIRITILISTVGYIVVAGIYNYFLPYQFYIPFALKKYFSLS